MTCVCLQSQSSASANSFAEPASSITIIILANPKALKRELFASNLRHVGAGSK